MRKIYLMQVTAEQNWSASDLTEDKAEAAAGFLKVLAHRERLAILCALVDGERAVSELEFMLELRQTTVSQHLARLRLEGFVCARRTGKQIFYSISDPRALEVMKTLHGLFCADK